MKTMQDIASRVAWCQNNRAYFREDAKDFSLQKYFDERGVLDVQE